MNKLTIRKATKAHRPIIRFLDREIFSGEDEDLDIRGAWWIVWDGAKPVGFAGCRSLAADPYAYFHRAGILPGYRGRGLHARLIRVRLAWARREKFKGVITYTMSDNHPSSNNLIEAGFKLFEPVYEWASEGALYWYKDFS